MELGVAVIVLTGVCVGGTAVEVGVCDGVGIGVCDGVTVGVYGGVGVGVDIGVCVEVLVGLGVEVLVGGMVGVTVGVAVSANPSTSILTGSLHGDESTINACPGVPLPAMCTRNRSW